VHPAPADANPFLETLRRYAPLSASETSKPAAGKQPDKQ
jgi:hypothetical protein